MIKAYGVQRHHTWCGTKFFVTAYRPVLADGGRMLWRRDYFCWGYYDECRARAEVKRMGEAAGCKWSSFNLAGEPVCLDSFRAAVLRGVLRDQESTPQAMEA